MFELHPKLAADTFHVSDLQLCRVLLMNDSRYPWLILVPKRVEITEVYQLEQSEQQQLWRESAFVGERLMQYTGGSKLNIAALGNVVPQLHVHHVARFQHDASWPAPIWGLGDAVAYAEDEAETQLAAYRQLFMNKPGYGD